MKIQLIHQGTCTGYSILRLEHTRVYTFVSRTLLDVASLLILYRLIDNATARRINKESLMITRTMNTGTGMSSYWWRRAITPHVTFVAKNTMMTAVTPAQRHSLKHVRSKFFILFCIWKTTNMNMKKWQDNFKMNKLLKLLFIFSSE